ncbi:YggS family pyridoxal phosphate-dependent enzyme [Bdellovibrionota bacterium FG-1]
MADADPSLADAYRQVLEKIEQAQVGRAERTQKITLIAVSKTQPVEAIAALYALGHRDFGENYVQELVGKAQRLEQLGCAGIRWHFIGHLQTNKVKTLVPYVHAVHSVDSEKLGRELAKRWGQFKGVEAAPLPIFIEVNIDAESSKSGVFPEQVPVLVPALASERTLSVQGLMAIPDPEVGGGGGSSAFARLCALELACRPLTHGQLSMGMSDDYEQAIAQGATYVRVGTAIFGVRD